MRGYVVKANVEPYEFLLSLDVAYEGERIPLRMGVISILLLHPRA